MRVWLNLAGLGCAAYQLFDAVFHGSVRSVRKKHRLPVVSLLIVIAQSVIFTMGFIMMFQVLGATGSALRGDFVIFIMSGVFLFMTHIGAISAVATAEGPASPIMQHGPMNTVIAVASAALGSFYMQLLSIIVILGFYYFAFTPFVIDQPLGTFMMFVLAWFSGCAIGLVIYALKPWAPDVVMLVQTVFQRLNMVASGKMFVANSLPGSVLIMFTWNPLFHVIDQARGFAFINYQPRNSDPLYPLYFSLGLLMIGFIGEYYTRQRASSSWLAKI